MDAPAGSPRYRYSGRGGAARSQLSTSTRPLLAILGSDESRGRNLHWRSKSEITTRSENQENS
jgi:hypothetical protein